MERTDILNKLPSSMLYTMTGTDAIPSRTRLSRFDATSSQYSSTSNNKILIPIQSDGFIDTANSYLYLNVISDITDGGGGDTYRLDGNVSALIDKLEISVAGSSGKVETIDRYNLYHLYDQIWNSGLDDIAYQNAVNGGSDPAVNWSAQGHQFAVAGGATRRNTVLAVKLKAGFLNSYYNKALPQGLPQFTIEVTLASGVQAFLAIGGNGGLTSSAYSVSECRFYAPVYQILDEGIMGAYTAQLRTQSTMWIGQSVGTIINNIAAVAAKQTVQLNASYRSLNAMVSLMRPSANINDMTKNVLTSTNITNVVGYLYRIMSVQYPQDQIDVNSTENSQGFNVSRVWMEAAKALAPHGHIHANTTSVRRDTFVSGTDAGAQVGCGSLCISLKRFSDDRLVNLGLDTSGSGAPSVLEVDFGANAPAAQDCTTYCLYDCVWILNPDGLVTRSF